MPFILIHKESDTRTNDHESLVYFIVWHITDTLVKLKEIPVLKRVFGQELSYPRDFSAISMR